MNKTTWYLLGFGAMVLLQWLVPLQSVFNQEKIGREGHTFRFRCAPVDPADPFRGKYITLQFQDNSYSSSFPFQLSSGDQIYVQIQNDSADFAIIKDISINPPEYVSHYFLATVQSYFSESNLVTVDFPFNRYYLEESLAPMAEKFYFESLQDSTKVTYALVNIHQGQAQLTDVHIDGISIRQLAENN